VEGSLDVEVFAKGLLSRVTVSLENHPVLVFIFKLPNIFFENIVYLLFGMKSVPKVEVIDFIIIFFHVFIYPYLVQNISLNAHPPDMLAMLGEDVLR
jgi:hypothetical protein